jgi:hypothetical protein
VIVVAEKDGRVILRRRTVVALKRMGSNGRRIEWDGVNNEKSSGYPSSKLEIETRWIEQSSYRSWVYSFLNFEDLEGMITDHGRISDG